MVAVGQVYQMTYVQHLAGQAMETVLHYREVTGSSTPAQIASDADLFWQILAQVQTPDVSYTQLIVKQMTPIPFDETINPAVIATTGANSVAVVNNTLAAVITKRTGTAGKSHRGRMYIGGLGSNHIATNTLSATGITAFTVFASTILSHWGPSGISPFLQIGIYSRSIGGSTPFTIAGWQPITKFDVQPIVGNQRRRRLGVGI